MPSKIKNKKRFHEDIIKFIDKVKLINKTYTIKTIEEEIFGVDMFFTSIKAYPLSSSITKSSSSISSILKL